MGRGPDEGISRWFAEQAARALDALRFNWGEAYKIWVGDDGRWMADRLDGLGETLAGGSPEELRQAILEDYMRKPVPRDLPGETLG